MSTDTLFGNDTVDLRGEHFKAAVCIEIENLDARRRLKKRLVACEPHINYLVAVGDGGFYIRIYESGEIFDAVNLPNNVIAFAKLVKYGVETCQTSANLFGHTSVLSGFRVAFYQVIVRISKTYAITSDLTYSSIRIILIAGKTSARLFV